MMMVEEAPLRWCGIAIRPVFGLGAVIQGERALILDQDKVVVRIVLWLELGPYWIWVRLLQWREQEYREQEGT